MTQVYNYMIQNYLPKRDTKYHAMKRNELKKVYDNIVNLSKHSPLYKINLSKENQVYAIDVKETAIAFKARIDDMQSPEYCFNSKTVSNNNNRILSAKLINEDTDKLPQTIEITVDALAQPQINQGKEIFHSSRGLGRGTYNFNAKIMDQTYSLSFTQVEKLDNKESLKNFVDFLNQSAPGISATIERGAKEEYSHIVIISDLTGKLGDKNFSFEETDKDQEGVVDFFGLNRMVQSPVNAQFKLNDINKQTTTNSFNLENTLNITLNHTGEQPVTLRIVPDSNPILNGVSTVLQTFNGLINLAKNRTEETTEHFGATKLMSELKNLEKTYKEELEACGLKYSEDGTLTIDEALAMQAAEDGGMESLFTRENGFIAKIHDKAETITINPMEYLDKTILTYPNNDKITYANPYVTSMYSGLFFSSYC